ncbi:OOP family OmpA-OmpF porin [Mesocricetibacter intestinalis]|uniref:OOP family OmpA-OmpF porin n=1 Tax=Mesocricetibacter intestinalis TaxID=1521930 RepID=A0A4R6V7E9_9PAST|nr:OmpA family protein [Mesocricetibacter intestinalis]TDQ57019.1 OOP family OmpA-OmpF porin [Mesocricetibacter intestinalis]
MKRTLLSMGCIVLLSACTNSNLTHHPEKSGLNPEGLKEHQALAVVYRDDISGPAINLYINGDYQASLIADSFTAATLCSSAQNLYLTYSNNRTFGNNIPGKSYDFTAGKTSYFKVTKAKEGFSLTEVNEAQAKRDIAALKSADHTLSRVQASNCNASVLSSKTLDNAALFAFDKYAYQDITQGGQQYLVTWVKDMLKQYPQQISGISVTGHTDAIGAAQYNQQLSQRRANTVKTILQQAGITQPIKAVGMGESQLIEKNCQGLNGQKLRDCNQPNRRVEITIYGKNNK